MKDKNSAFYLLLEYLKYYMKSNNAHGLHSPFVFNLYNDLFKDKTPFYCFQEIENLRNDLKLNFTEIELEDYGAGSRSNVSNSKSISEIANTSLTKPKYAQLLFRLLNQSSSNSNIVELGTSLGITTAYLASVNPNSRVYSFEGDTEVAKIANGNFESLNLSNVDLKVGEFENTLIPWLGSIDFKLDFVFLDGNHKQDATLKYFELFLPHIHENTIMVLDDIRWSKGMEKAWNEIKVRSEVGVSIDIFQMGILFFKQDQEKEEFVIRY